MNRETGSRHEQVFICPACGGPLHVLEDGDFECEVRHRYGLEGAVASHTGLTTQALMRAVSSLRDRAAMSRWAAGHPELYPNRDSADLTQAAKLDDEMADVLLRHARALRPETGKVRAPLRPSSS
jgi:hypothetical protein